MRTAVFPSTVCFLLTVALVADAANWAAWRGPKGDGTTAETDLPLRWSATENIAWKAALPERGNSTPIVWGNRIFVTQAVGTRRTVISLDRTDGKLLWQRGRDWTAKDRTHATNPL